MTHTHPSVLPASVVIVQSPLHGVLHEAPSLTPEAHEGGVPLG